MEVSCYNYYASSVHVSFKVSSGMTVQAAAVTVTCLSLVKYICNVLVDTNAFGKVFPLCSFRNQRFKKMVPHIFK